jgi:hypothetical protein
MVIRDRKSGLRGDTQNSHLRIGTEQASGVAFYRIVICVLQN